MVTATSLTLKGRSITEGLDKAIGEGKYFYCLLNQIFCICVCCFVIPNIPARGSNYIYRTFTCPVDDLIIFFNMSSHKIPSSLTFKVMESLQFLKISLLDIHYVSNLEGKRRIIKQK